MICINDLVNADGVWYNVGDFYEYEGLPSFLILKIFFNSDGSGSLRSMAMNRESLLNYFMVYTDWLALERQKQIDSVIND